MPEYEWESIAPSAKDMEIGDDPKQFPLAATAKNKDGTATVETALQTAHPGSTWSVERSGDTVTVRHIS